MADIRDPENIRDPRRSEGLRDAPNRVRPPVPPPLPEYFRWLTPLSALLGTAALILHFFPNPQTQQLARSVEHIQEWVDQTAGTRFSSGESVQNNQRERGQFSRELMSRTRDRGGTR